MLFYSGPPAEQMNSLRHNVNRSRPAPAGIANSYKYLADIQKQFAFNRSLSHGLSLVVFTKSVCEPLDELIPAHSICYFIVSVFAEVSFPACHSVMMGGNAFTTCATSSNHGPLCATAVSDRPCASALSVRKVELCTMSARCFCSGSSKSADLRLWSGQPERSVMVDLSPASCHCLLCPRPKRSFPHGTELLPEDGRRGRAPLGHLLPDVRLAVSPPTFVGELWWLICRLAAGHCKNNNVSNGGAPRDVCPVVFSCSSDV